MTKVIGVLMKKSLRNELALWFYEQVIKVTIHGVLNII